MKKHYLVAGIVLVGVGALALYTSQRVGQSSVVTPDPLPVNLAVRPHSFAECVTQGYPVQESQPRRCQAGKIAFVENAEDVPVATESTPVVLEALPANAYVTSPTVLHGKALGTWFFEASFPVRVLDAQGNVIAETQARAGADWQTIDYVPFTVTLSFTALRTETGFVEFAKDNPSGLSDLDASVRVPVRFK